MHLEAALLRLALESWRLSRLCVRVLSKLDAGEAGRYQSQLRYVQQNVGETLDAAGLRLVNLEGQPYDPGMAAAALNLADFEPGDSLLVDQMVEPIIMGTDGLRHQGVIMLRKIEL